MLTVVRLRESVISLTSERLGRASVQGEIAVKLNFEAFTYPSYIQINVHVAPITCTSIFKYNI